MSQNMNPFIKVHYRLGHPLYWPNFSSPSLEGFIRNMIKLNKMRKLRDIKGILNPVFRRTLQLFGISYRIYIYTIKKER